MFESQGVTMKPDSIVVETSACGSEQQAPFLHTALLGRLSRAGYSMPMHAHDPV